MVAWIPDKGEIVWLHFDPQAGHEQAGRRPALVLSPRAYNALAGLCVVAPITNQVKGYPFELALPSHCETSGVLLCDQIRCLDWRARAAAHKEFVGETLVREVLAKFLPLIT